MVTSEPLKRLRRAIEVQLAAQDSSVGKAIARRKAVVDYLLANEDFKEYFQEQRETLLSEWLTSEVRRHSQVMAESLQLPLPGFEAFRPTSKILLEDGRRISILDANIGMIESAEKAINKRFASRKPPPELAELGRMKELLRRGRKKIHAKVLGDLPEFGMPATKAAAR